MLSLSFAFCISSLKDLEELCLHWGSLSKAIGKEPPLNRLSSLSGLNVNYVITSVACAWHPSVPFLWYETSLGTGEMDQKGSL